jgi:hypothetical protein
LRTRRRATGSIGRLSRIELPYGGAFEDVIPHLTVGEKALGSLTELRSAAAGLVRGLPVRGRISAAWLMTGGTAHSSWRTVAELPLGGALRRCGPAANSTGRAAAGGLAELARAVSSAGYRAGRLCRKSMRPAK